MRGTDLVAAVLLIGGGIANTAARDTANTISRNEFNFGHQLGYMYSRMDDA
jgi:hypothetical protein